MSYLGVNPSPSNPLVLGLLFVAAVLGGALNSVAGGGSFIAFPALLFAGVSPVVANATNTVALWPGNVASAFGYRRELKGDSRMLMALGIASALGGIAGATLLLHTREATFVTLIPWLLLVATLLFTAGPWISRRWQHAPRTQRSLVAAFAAQLMFAVYGGYFGAGLGILILAALAFLGMNDIHQMNGIKSILSGVVNGVAVVMFALEGAVAWRPGAVMVAGGILGGFAGASIARRFAPDRVRLLAVAVAWGMTAWFFIRPAG